MKTPRRTFPFSRNSLAVASLAILTASMASSNAYSSTQIVGDDGTDTLDISTSDSSGNDVVVGAQATGSGLVTVSNGATWDVGTLTVGDAGTGSVTISGSSTLSSAGVVVVGAQAGGQGSQTFSDGSTWKSTGDLIVGDAGTGSFSVTDGNMINTGAFVVIGAQAGGQGSVTISGSTIWNNNYAELIVGNYGTGSLSVDAISVSTSGTFVIGAQAGGEGSVFVSGSSIWNAGDLTVGDAGTGSLVISGSAQLNNFGNGTVIGAQTGGLGSAFVSGSAAWTSVGNVFTIGDAGTGSLTISETAAVTSLGEVALGAQADGKGSVTVSGSSSWKIGFSAGPINNLTVGDAGTGSLAIWDGALVTVSGDTVVGAQVGGKGSAIVSGTGSSWETGGDLSVGKLGDGLVALFDGALITNNNGFIGTGDGASGLVVVSGTGSRWQNDGNLTVGGERGRGILAIADGGSVRAANYSQSKNGTLEIQLSSHSHYGGLSVVGAANLDGKLEVSFLNGFRAKVGDKYTIITAGEVSGKFDATSTGTIMKASVDYLPESVLLEIEQGSFAALNGELGYTPNQLRVAKALDKIAGDSKVSKLIGELDILPIDQIPDALTLLSPEEFAAIFNIGFATAQIQLENIERHLDDVHNGVAGFSTNGLALSNSHGMLTAEGLSLAGFDGKSMVGKQAFVPVVETDRRWSFFATGVGEFGDIESTANAPGAEFTTGGVTIGADYRLSQNAVVGLTLGYANTSTDLSNGGDLDIDGGKIGLYGSVFGNGFYLNGAVGGGYSSYDTKRSTFGGYANGNTDGVDFSALLGTGYDAHFGGLTVGPIASVRYAYVGIDGFTEDGSLAPLHIDSQSQDSLKSTVGLKAAYTWQAGQVVITPEVRAQWAHEYLDSTASVESRFAAGDSFTVDGPDIGRDSLLLDAGLSVQFNPAMGVFAYYTGEIGRDNYSSNSINGGVRINF